ncbi:hypothetical protein [Cryptosporangium sp. NPDC048952]|uniref:hypothetical protein n=1 Tax=Cryptosporangium sp. NPDC048952 TaxID=3363961 RepID=UPI003710E358
MPATTLAATVSRHDRLARARITAGGEHYPVPSGVLETAENLRRDYGIGRVEEDEYALRSHEAGGGRAEGRAVRRRAGAGSAGNRVGGRGIRSVPPGAASLRRCCTSSTSGTRATGKTRGVTV